MSRIQFVLRDWGEADKAVDPVRKTTGNAIPANTHLSLVTGLLEAKAGTISEDSMIVFVFDAKTDRTFLSKAKPITDPDALAMGRFSDIDCWLTQSIWRGPISPLPSGMRAGSVVARRCAMPVSEGHEAWLLCGMVFSAPGSSVGIPFIREGTGGDDLRFLVHYSDRLLDLPPPGETIRQIFLEPNWGWGPEPLAFRSTLRLDVMAAMDRGIPLRMKAVRTPEEEAELRHIFEVTGGIGRSSDSDPEFRRFLSLIVAADPDDTGNTHIPLTAARLNRRGRLTDIVVGEMLETDDDELALASIRAKAAEEGLVAGQDAPLAHAMP